ncbi:MAG: isochorismatase family protein [bacterium]
MDFEKFIPQEDLKAYQNLQKTPLMGFGKRPCLMVVDMTYAFVDPSFGITSGDMGWQAASNIKVLLEKAREKKVPIIYSTGFPVRNNPVDVGISRKAGMSPELYRGQGNQIVPEIAPQPDEIVIEKHKASVFFASNLAGTLINLDVDTLVVTGATTSGCVRATVVDAASYNYYVTVPEECVSDRSKGPHYSNLFDMHMKYADVIPMAEVLEYFSTIR